MTASITTAVVYPKTNYAWTDRTGITAPDTTDALDTASLTKISAADGGTLVITVDGSVPKAVIGIAVVLWDERGISTSIFNGSVTLSTWAKNAAGYYIAANNGEAPGFLTIDISLAASFTILVQSLIPAGNYNLHWKFF